MTNPLTYVPAPIPDDCHFKISPSQFAQFIQYPHKWYRTEILKEDVFSHNTAAVIGTCVHYCAEQVALGEPVNKKIIEDYIYGLDLHEDYNPEVVMEHYVAMAEELVNAYVIHGEYLEVEFTSSAKLRAGYAVGGTADRIEGTKDDLLLVDYKTYSSKTKPKTIPLSYKYQLLVYAWLLRQNGYNTKRVRLVYVNRHIEGEISEKTGKKLKSYPPEVTILTEEITQEDYDFIEGLLYLCVDSCEAAKEYPELLHVIFHDPRLKT